MYNCICCHHRLLRHLNRQRAYWFCPSCHQEMPNLDPIMLKTIDDTKRSHRVSVLGNV